MFEQISQIDFVSNNLHVPVLDTWLQSLAADTVKYAKADQQEQKVQVTQITFLIL